MTSVQTFIEAVSKTSQKNQDSDFMDQAKLLTIKELAAIYGLSQSTIYSLISTEPSFPFLNVGRKKKYMVSRSLFEKWLTDRAIAEKQKTFGILGGEDLLDRFKR